MRPIGTAAELERRRHLAVARLGDGHSAGEVADFLVVHPRTVYRWQRAAGRPTGLAAKPPPGRPRKLTAARERQVLGWFRKSPRSFGFPTDLWTARRVAAVIARKWGVRFNSRYLSAWLSARGVTPQKPQRVSREADPDAIAAWRTQYWPRLQNGRARQRATVAFVDECGLTLAPLCRRTLAPKGHTPRLVVRGRHRQKVSVIAALTLSPRRRRVGLLSHTLPDASFTGATVAAFLRRLLRRVRGRLIVVWDRWSGHGGPAVRAVLAAHPRLTVERLPPYAPDLNPVEHLWSLVKWGELCNFAPADAAELDAAARPVLARLARAQPLLRSCWRGAKLHVPRWRC